MSVLSGLNHISGLPMPVKGGLGFAGCGAILGVAWFLLGDSPNKAHAMLILTVGMIVVVLLVVGFQALVKWNRKRKANPMAQGIAGNAAAAPQGVSEPARRARLDDLRRNFEQGVEKFRAAGKNLYSVPWYVLVGEPGSGKTEAIRHCNVGFPPGLQDQLQGAGGTLNMNWWFTNAAIILDTAGRLMFEEIPPGSTNEWAEFLKLLKQNRPNCPINGMLLVIPVDTLIKDSADAIEKKATKIAQQFEQIQRTLGVRFPVFVIITKCDLLNGFREFFDDLNDPQLQHQIMGWSNPAALDERFDPTKVTLHLETVRERLASRRQNLLLDPVNTEDPQGRRVDQVDALYALPDSITKIGPRLTRYLELIFVAGEWSPKPLFLRGIYFTSSMTEGAALDAELAEALGVPVDSLPGGAIFRKDRAYFLRDLFLEKVFREKGLVTRATNADKQQSTRRAVVLGAGFFAVLLLFVFTWLGSRSLSKSLGAETNFWSAVAKLPQDKNAIIQTTPITLYRGDAAINVGSNILPLAQLFGKNLDNVKSDIAIPIIFRPMTALSTGINGERRMAYRALYESLVLRPAFSAARAKISSDWDPQKGPAALAELLKIEYALDAKKLPQVPNPQVKLDPLFAFVLSPDDYAKFQKDSESLQQVADWIYTPQAGEKNADGTPAWPAKLLSPGTVPSLDAVNAGVAGTISYWDAQFTTGNAGRTATLAAIDKLRDELTAFRAAQETLVANNPQSLENIDVYVAFRDKWNDQLGRLRIAAKAASEDWAPLANGKSDALLATLYAKEMDTLSTRARENYKTLIALTELPQGSDTTSESAKALTLAHDKLKAALDRLDAQKSADTVKILADLDARFIKQVKDIDGTPRPRFEVFLQLLDAADALMVKGDIKPPEGSLATVFTSVDDTHSLASTKAEKLQIQSVNREDPLAQVIVLSQYAIESSARAKKYLYSQAVLGAMPAKSEDWPAYVAKAAASAPKDNLLRPQVPLVAFPEPKETFNPQFAPDSVYAVVQSLDAVARLTAAGTADVGGIRVLNGPQLASKTTEIRKGFSDYRTLYIHYWREDVKDELHLSYKTFSALANDLVSVGEKTVRGSLDDYGKRMAYALNKVGATDDETAVRLGAQLGQNATFQGECADVLARWRELGDDPKIVRRSILGMIPGDFTDKFVVVSAKTNDGFVGRYWQSFPREALRVLAADSLVEIDAGLRDLAGYQRFPLALPGDKRDDLPLADVLKARTALERVRGATAGSAAAATSSATRVIGAGGNTRDKEIDNNLDVLRGTNLLRDKQDYFDKLDKLFAGLPRDAKPLTFTLSVDKTKLTDRLTAISTPFSYMTISAAGKAIGQPSSLISEKLDNYPIDLPAAGDLAFDFRTTQTGNPIQSETFAGPWGIFRLILSPNVKSLTRDGNKWAIEYTVTTADKKNWSLFLNLEFKQPIPDPKDWPVPPTK